MKKYYIPFAIAFLLGISIFSIYKYSVSVKERAELRAFLSASQQQTKELRGQNEAVKGKLDESSRELQRLEKENADLKAAVKGGEETIARLSAKLKEGIKESEALQQRFSRLQEEKSALQSALDSVSELQKRIRELRLRARHVSKQKSERNKGPSSGLRTGNEGYLFRDGKTTYTTPRITIEVEPAVKK